MKRLFSYCRCLLLTLFNIFYNAKTVGRKLWLEGRVDSTGLFRNWSRFISYRPQRVVYPRTEAEIVDLVRQSKKIRAFGSGHSFNRGVESSEVLISLDQYSGVISEDESKKTLRVMGGTRIRDVNKILERKGWAFRGLPSHDAQSIAGILSTDVHGTGRNWGFVSEMVLGLTIIDGLGIRYDVRPGDPLFHAAIGGIGAVGLITEVEVQATCQFKVEQVVELSTISQVQTDFDILHARNEHLSFYFFPFTEVCQINRWNRHAGPVSKLGALREFLSISSDAALVASVGNALSYLGLLPRFSDLAHKVKKGTDLVLPSAQAYNRTIYPLHQEFEFTIPLDRWLETVMQFKALYEELYRKNGGLPYALFEVRFTPNSSQSMIGAGAGRPCCWIDLVINDSSEFELFYDAAEALMKQLGAKPHLGKWLGSVDGHYLAQVHGQAYSDFVELRRKHDPDAKFENLLTQKLF